MVQKVSRRAMAWSKNFEVGVVSVQRVSRELEVMA